MSKFLTPPVWYDKNGSEINIFNNTTYNGVVDNTAIGTSAIAGRPSSEGVSFGAVAVGSQAQAKAPLSIAVGSYNDDNFQTVQALAIGSIAIGAGAKANTDSTDGIAIGSRATSGQGGIAIGAGASAIGDDMIQLGNNNTAYTLNIGNGTGTINGVRLSASSGVIQLGQNNTAYALNVGNGTGTIGIGGVSCNNLTVKVLMKTPLVGFDLSNNFDSGYVNIGNNSDGTPWSYSFSLVTDTNQLYKNRIDSIPYLLVRVTLKPDLGFPRSLMCPTLIPDRDSWVCMSQWNVIEMDGSLNSILSMRLSSSLDNVGNPKITIALRSPSGHAINQDYKKIALEVVRVLNTNFTTP